MMRGRRILYDNLLKSDVDPFVKPKAEHKGRSQDLIGQRNSCLVHRYVYYIKIHNLNFISAVNKVSHELFLSPRTVTDLLTENQSEVKNVRDKVKELKRFKELFPFLDWTPKR